MVWNAFQFGSYMTSGKRYNANKIGPRTEPWGTPHDKVEEHVGTEPEQKNCFLKDRRRQSLGCCDPQYQTLCCTCLLSNWPDTKNKWIQMLYVWFEWRDTLNFPPIGPCTPTVSLQIFSSTAFLHRHTRPPAPACSPSPSFIPSRA